jgi:hypothetical protein
VTSVSALATVRLGIMPYGAALVVRGNVLRRALPFEKCLPPGVIFTSFALIIAKPPVGGRKLSFREAVLPLMYLVKEDGLQLGRCRPLNTMRTFRIADVDRSDRRPRREPQQGGAELWLMSVWQAAAIRTKVVAAWAHSRRHYHERRDHHRRPIQSAVANAAAIWAAVKAQPTKVRTTAMQIRQLCFRRRSRYKKLYRVCS